MVNKLKKTWNPVDRTRHPFPKKNTKHKLNSLILLSFASPTYPSTTWFLCLSSKKTVSNKTKIDITEFPSRNGLSWWDLLGLPSSEKIWGFLRWTNGGLLISVSSRNNKQSSHIFGGQQTVGFSGWFWNWQFFWLTPKKRRNCDEKKRKTGSGSWIHPDPIGGSNRKIILGLLVRWLGEKKQKYSPMV